MLLNDDAQAEDVAIDFVADRAFEFADDVGDGLGAETMLGVIAFGRFDASIIIDGKLADEVIGFLDEAVTLAFVCPKADHAFLGILKAIDGFDRVIQYIKE